MSADLLSPTTQLDIRVAQSPVVALRYGIDGRCADLDDLAARLEAAQRELNIRRDTLRRRLDEHPTRAGAGQQVAGAAAQLRSLLEEGIALRAELAAAEEGIECLGQRIEGLREQRSGLHALSSAMARLDGLHDVAIDGGGASANQAVRQLFQLVAADHEATAHEILEGPMQLLADAALQTELIGRVLRDDRGGAAADAARCRAATNAALRELNRVIFRIHPDWLRDEGLVPSLRRLLDDVQPATSVRLLVLGGPRRVRHGVETAAFRIVQEAISNAVGHGGAASVEVVLLYQPERLVVVVRDDGDGFDVSAVTARMGRSHGLGLVTMRQRAEIEDGALEVLSAVGSGTEVRASFSRPD